MKSRKRLSVHMSHYPLQFDFHSFVVSLLFKEQDGEVFDSFLLLFFGVGAVQVFV